MRTLFANVENWVFDLDNTLYPRTCRLFDQIDIKITDYVEKITGLERTEARLLQKKFFREYGTTLSGLMATRDIDADAYLNAVHDIDYSSVDPHPELIKAIKALPGRKLIFTNADTGHTESVLARLGASDLFDGIFDIRDANLQPKPDKVAYDAFYAHFDVDPAKAAMFEDMQKNLLVPHQTGMRTIHVIPDASFSDDTLEPFELERKDDEPHIHHVTDDLAAFLAQLG